MKSKQLANVLIKMLGFSVCIYAIPSCALGFIVMLSDKAMSKDVTVLGLSATAAEAVVQAVVGIVIICMSQKIAGLMFKTDDE